jgi:diguanylate cyclase (GGDEF)-like protein
MAEARETRPIQPSMLARADEIQQQLQQLSGRDLQLWSIGALVILVLTAGLLSLLLPNLMWAHRLVKVEQSYVPQVFFGLISLVMLFNIYILGQKRSLNITRRALIRELVLNERLENLSLVDPLTQLLNRRAMNEVIAREVARANRSGTPMTFMAIDLEGFGRINSKFGMPEGDQLLIDLSRLLKSVFRGGDLVFRQGGDEFLVLMPDTDEGQAEFPVQRLQHAIEQWNLGSKKSYELAITWGLASYITGTDVDDVLRAVDRRMYQKKHNLAPVF